MNKPSKNEITDNFEELAGNQQVQSAVNLEVTYLTRKYCKDRFNVQDQFSTDDGESINKLSSKKWQSWHVDGTAHFGDPRTKYKKGSVDIKNLMLWVRIIAQKIHRPLPSNIMLNDLVQDGMLGLIMAFREYDEDTGIPFHSFAENKIRWSIIDGLRAGDWAGRSVRRRASKVDKTIEKLQALLHRKPSTSEIADELGVRVDDISTTLGDAYGYNFVRIDDGVEGAALDIPDSRMEPSAIAERRESYSRAVASLRILQPSERKAFILRIMCDLSGRQAATEMGVSESRVSQLYKTATEKLANYV